MQCIDRIAIRNPRSSSARSPQLPDGPSKVQEGIERRDEMRGFDSTMPSSLVSMVNFIQEKTNVSSLGAFS